ncbi:autotransporter domain-containing protein [Sphingomonas sp. BK235]|uniref:autotransporter domain-containing protein n=1 Tax=Sphingomonas sp. BK235 TaxID=2512131 RepID=UPI0010430B3D|nr:autotransporter domain-containing protein [Sphingomonas sp. BK235]
MTLSLVNSGTIAGGTRLTGFDFKGVGATVSLDNSGTLTTSNSSTALTLTRYNYSQTPALAADWKIHNSGTIKADFDLTTDPNVFATALLLIDPAAESRISVTNDAGGLISAKGSSAITIGILGGNLTLSNAGTISAVSAAGGDHVAIFASGGDNRITNTGAIIGDVVLGAGGDVVANWGSIDGNVSLGAGDDVFVEGENSKVTGTVVGGAGLDTYIHARKTSGTVTLGTDRPGDFELEGVRALGSGTVATIEAAAPIGRPILLDGDGSIVNKADITGTIWSVASPDLDAGTLLGSFQNKGKLSGGFHGALHRLDNDGTITATTGPAVSIVQSEGLVLNNHGQTSHASDADVAVLAVTTGGEVVTTNSGSIDGSLLLDSFNSPDGARNPLLVSLSNTGSIVTTTSTLPTVTIKANDALGVATALRLDNSGTIRHAGSGPAIYALIGEGDTTAPGASRALSVSNSGVIAADATGTRDGGDGIVGEALRLNATLTGTVTVSNSSTGKILAIGSNPVAISAIAASFNLDNAGLIEVKSDTPQGSDKPPLFAIFSLATNSSIVNKGKISGDIALVSKVASVTNSGTIDGSVWLGDGDATFTAAGGVVSGGVFGGAGRSVVRVIASSASPTSAFHDIYGVDSIAVSGGAATVSGLAQAKRIDLTGGSLVGLRGSLIETGRVTVGKAATFGSAGLVRGDVVVAGTLSPGSSPGTMGVIGNVTLQNGSRSLFELTRTAQDRLLIDGGLRIEKGATLSIASGSLIRPGVGYTLIATTKGITGSYDTLDLPAGAALALSQTASQIGALGLFGRSAQFSPLVNGSIDYANQRIVRGASPALAAHWSNLYDDDGLSRPAAFAQLTPQAYAAATQIGVDDALTLSHAARGPAFAPYGTDSGLFTFGQAIGSWHTLRANPSTGSAPATGSAYGTLGGIGFADAGWVVGAFAGNLTNQQQLQGLGTHSRVGSLVTGAHGRYASGSGLGFSSSLIFDAGRARTHRWLPDGRRVWSHFDLDSMVSDLSAFYAADVGHDWTLTPRLGVTYVHTVRSRAKEQGGSVFALDVRRERHTAGFLDGGIALERSDASPEAWRPFVALGARYLLQGESVRALAGYDRGPRTLAGVGADRAELVGTASAGVGYRPSDAIEIFAAGSAQTGRDDHQESITAGVRARF